MVTHVSGLAMGDDSIELTSDETPSWPRTGKQSYSCCSRWQTEGKIVFSIGGRGYCNTVLA